MRISYWSSDVCSSDLVVAQELKCEGRSRQQRVEIVEGRARVILEDFALFVALVLVYGLDGFEEDDVVGSLRQRFERLLIGLVAMIDKIGKASCRERGC